MDYFGEFEADPDRLRKILKRLREMLVTKFLQAESLQKMKQWMEIPELRNHKESNVKEKLSCEPLLSQNFRPLDFPYSKRCKYMQIGKKITIVVEPLCGLS